MTDFIYLILAILGLGVLVFIHELGHYWVARRNGMRVEAFAIGFGKPIVTWERDGVKWHICILPFGGYVKIAGMQKEGTREPSEIPDGFYGKKPWQRIQVALAGPLVNIAFAFIVFVFLWISGGRDKQFTEFTQHIGWVDPHSPLYEKGIRSGDIIEKYDGRPFHGFKDLLMAGLMKGDTTQIEGTSIDPISGEKSRYNYTLKNYQNPTLLGTKKISTIGIVSPARYLIYPGPELMAGSPMLASGIRPYDRIVWADGETLFSQQQLSHLINESTAFLTIQRGSQVIQTKVPRIQLSDLKLTPPERGEIDDWQHEAHLKGRLQDLYFIPYNLSPTLSIESPIQFIDEADQKNAFQPCQRCAYFTPLQEGDQILAIDGTQVNSPYQLLAHLQKRHVLMIIDRNRVAIQKELWTRAEVQFDQLNTTDLKQIIHSIGTNQPLRESGTLHLLQPVAPKSLTEFPFTEKQRGAFVQELAQSKKEAEAIQDPDERNAALLDLEKSQRKLVLGVSLADREVLYNPTPPQQFLDVFNDTYHMFAGLITGSANPKYVAGPVGIVQIVHQSWMMGAKEALFWMALISLNLGILNLLPLPVLDGGHIVFSLLEIVTRRPLKAKTMEKLVVPFVLLLIGFFIFVTFNDITRLFSKFF